MINLHTLLAGSEETCRFKIILMYASPATQEKYERIRVVTSHGEMDSAITLLRFNERTGLA